MCVTHEDAGLSIAIFWSCAIEFRPRGLLTHHDLFTDFSYGNSYQLQSGPGLCLYSAVHTYV